MFFTFVGQQSPIDVSNCKYVTYFPNDELPKVYNEHEYFIHLPNTAQPLERTVAEG